MACFYLPCWQCRLCIEVGRSVQFIISNAICSHTIHLYQSLLRNEEYQGPQCNGDRFTQMLAIFFFQVNIFQLYNATSSLDPHWILVQLSGLIEGNLCFSKMKNFFQICTLAYFSNFGSLPIIENCRIVFGFDIVVE